MKLTNIKYINIYLEHWVVCMYLALGIHTDKLKKEKMKQVLQFIWLLPATILVWLFYILPLWLVTGDIVYEGKEPSMPVWIFKVVSKRSWYGRAWHRWLGWSGPCVYLYKNADNPNLDKVTRIHELAHCKQQFKWGFIYYFVYILATIEILISNYWSKNKRHGYLDNPFERAARKEAGQVVNIPKEYWTDGPNDYNPWI